jgi:hypothetical protein
MAALDPNTLLDETKCYACFGMSIGQLLELALLSRISGGGGAATGGITFGVGPPVAAPLAGVGIYFDTASGVQYNYYSGAWH